MKKSPEILLTVEDLRRRDLKINGLFSASQRLRGKDRNFSQLLSPWAGFCRRGAAFFSRTLSRALESLERSWKPRQCSFDRGPFSRLFPECAGSVAVGKEALLASAALGRQIAALLGTETAVGAVREPPLQKIATFTLPQMTILDGAKHFAVTAGWGHAGQGGVTMPGISVNPQRGRDWSEGHRLTIG